MGTGENIKILREKYGLTQQDIANIAGVTNKAVSAWETGLKEPRMGVIEKIVAHFGIKKSNLIDDDGGVSRLTPKEERDITKDLERMLANLESENGIAYLGGEPMDDETKELMKISLENSMRLAKQLAKKKFTPKKYK